MDALQKNSFKYRAKANKALVLTAPALCNFGIIARPKHFGGGVGIFLPHTARERRHNAGVRPLPRYVQIIQGHSTLDSSRYGEKDESANRDVI